MALNIAVPLATVGDLIDNFGLLSPISPLSVDCSGVATAGGHGRKQLISPVGSESSGVSSLDSDDAKKPSSPPTTPNEEVDRPIASSPLSSAAVDSDIFVSASESTGIESSSCLSNRSSLSSVDSTISDCNSSEESAQAEELPEAEPTIPKKIKLVIGGRNVLDLMDNLSSPDYFRMQFAQLPENDNIHFFLDNRSQYHRLGANGHIQEYTMVKCKCCEFRYPVNGMSPISGGLMPPTGQSNWLKTAQQQYQTKLQQQPSFQWNNFNNYDSISSRNKSSLNVSANAFNRTFGGGNNNNNNGSQYYRSNLTTSLFGRESNRNIGNGNFLNNSTSTYNNHKSYQQSFVPSNNNTTGKLNNPYGNYQFQQQQQQMLPKSQQMRYNSGSNGSGGFNASAAVAAASAMAGQNMLNFNGNGKNNNNNNMFAYFKAMMN